MGIGEKWVKYGRVELWERKTGRNRDGNWERSVRLGREKVGTGRERGKSRRK